ncbi:hypothetical protein Tco_0778514, partial [Tanacetum coccineum]
VRLPDLKLKTLGERGIERIFVGYAEHSKAFRFYVIKPNNSVEINSIIESRDAIFDENIFSSVPRPSQIGGLVVPKKVTEEVVQQPEPELKKSKRHRTPKDFGPEFQFYLIEGVRDEVSDQHSYCFNVEDDPKIFDKMDVKTAFLNGELDEEVDLTKEFLSSRFSMKDMGEADVILVYRLAHFISVYLFEKVLKKFNYFDCTPVSTPINTSEKLMPNNGQAISQLEYSRVIGCLMYAMTCIRPDIAFAMGKLSRYTSNPGTQHWQAIQRVLKYLKKTMDYRLIYISYPSVLEGYTDASWISNIEDNSSTSGWSQFVALAAVGKEAEWLINLLLEIPLWSKPITPNSIHCDSAATLAKAYSQMSQQNLADHLMKGLARDLVIKYAEGMGLKGLKHMYLQIIPRMCLEPAEKEDEVVNFLMVNFFGKVLSRSINKEEPPMVQFIPGNGAGRYGSVHLVSNSGLKDIHQSDGFSFEPSAGMLLSGPTDGSGFPELTTRWNEFNDL